MPKNNQPQPMTEAQQLEKAMNDMALNIDRISNAFAALEKAPIRRNLLLLMIKDMTGVNYTDIDKVLDALPSLKKKYLK